MCLSLDVNQRENMTCEVCCSHQNALQLDGLSPASLNLSSVPATELRERSPHRASLLRSTVQKHAHSASSGARLRPALGLCPTSSCPRSSIRPSSLPQLGNCHANCTRSATRCSPLLGLAIEKTSFLRCSRIVPCPLRSAAQDRVLLSLAPQDMFLQLYQCKSLCWNVLRDKVERALRARVTCSAACGHGHH